ncbi:MAG: hypothetical protein KDC07_03915 [Chitinophagaceae bacterium]|nr:hypothetical protein [Chitinophagaceae bacterium]MCB9045542.1 hypothetical protein [Chitinophagales bacterium]
MKHVFVTLALWLSFWSAHAIAVDTTNGCTAPAKVSGDARTLAQYLCDAMLSDSMKANMIYNWITHNIEYDIKGAKDPERAPSTVQSVLRDKKAVCDGYAILFVEMCKAVGLDAVCVDGYAKDWKFDNNDTFYIPRHEWCAVMIDRRWELVDPTFGAGGITRAPGWFRSQLNRFTKEKIRYSKKEVFEFHYEPDYFLMSPADFRHTHLPSDPLWQLMKVPMPITVFQQGDTAINEFNTENGARIHRSPELEYIARLNEPQKLVEYSDRAYKFNPRYDMVMAMKEQIIAAEALAKYASRRNIPPRHTFEEAYKGIVQAGEYLERQKAYIPGQYNELKRRNIDKNKAANDRIRDIRVHNKQLTAQCRMRKATADRKKDALNNKQDRADILLEKITPDKIDSLKTISIQRDLNSPMMVTLSDSIKAKQARLKKANFETIEKMQAITLLQEENKALNEVLSHIIPLSDTVLTAETELRLNFRDSYDDNVKLCIKVFNQLRFEEGDTVQHRYLDNFDTLVVYYEDLLKIYLQQADLYRSSLRDMEQFRRWNNSREDIVASYHYACKGYTDAINQYQQNMNVYSNYLADNGNAFETMMKMYEDELDLLDRMAEGETARKEAEETDLNEDRTFDERELENKQQTISKMKDQLTEILSR